jgi:hypothetical protein
LHVQQGDAGVGPEIDTGQSVLLDVEGADGLISADVQMAQLVVIEQDLPEGGVTADFPAGQLILPQMQLFKAIVLSMLKLASPNFIDTRVRLSPGLYSLIVQDSCVD